VTADEELWFAEALWFDEALEPVDDEESSPLEDVVAEVEKSSGVVAFAVVAVSDWPVAVCVVPLVVALPSEPPAAIVPKATAKVASAAATTRRRMAAIRRARARRRSRTRSVFESGGGVEGMRPS
jgi:hypothetical protein